jgi:hypothetical protein
MLDVPDADTANVADAVWTANSFQSTYAEDANEFAPYHHRSACNGRGRSGTIRLHTLH